MEEFVIRLNDRGEKLLTECNLNEGTAIIPDGVVHIGGNAFKDRAVNKVILPPSVKTVEHGSFSYCKMEEIILPTELEVIENEAFNSCMKLKSVIIPHSVKRIAT